MKIIYFYNEDWEQEYIQSRMEGHELIFHKGSVQDNSSVSDPQAESLSVFVNSHVGAEEMDRFPKLRFIATRSTGFDHIDLDEAQKRGISVANVPTYGENTVAEFAFALLLSLSRKVYDSYERIRESGSFSKDGLTGFDLKGKTFGIVGTGHIGEHSIRMAKGFGMDVIAFDVNHRNDLVAELGFRYVEFDELLANAHIISLHAPYNEHTHHMINHDNLSKVKPGAYLINTARGGLVETSALIEGLEKGIFAGAGLDVLEEEEFPGDEVSLLTQPHPNEESMRTLLSNHYLIDHPRVIVTPHNAFNTTEAIERILDTSIGNMKHFSEEKPVNIVQKK